MFTGESNTLISTLVVPDIHNNLKMLKKAARHLAGSPKNKVVFLGDYCDSWFRIVSNRQTIEAVLDIYNNFKGRVVLLVGNHDISNLLGGDWACGGYNEKQAEEFKKVFKKHIDKFQVAYWDGEYMFSHAGFTTEWLDKYLSGERSPEKIAQMANEMFTNEQYEDLYSAPVSRGGTGAAGPLWADKKDLEKLNPKGFKQVVGHTPVTNVVIRDNLIFCDTHSTRLIYRSIEENIGDQGWLILERSE